MNSVVFIVLLGIISHVSSHGVMTKPLTRNDYLAYNDPGKNYNDGSPVPWPQDDTFVCRDHNEPSKQENFVTLTAGVPFEVDWSNGHPGDVFLYITYDGDKSNSEKNWFKIYNWTQDPASPAEKPRGMLPSDLPSSSHAILRWEMYALHVKGSGTIELYAACTDIIINGKAGGVIPGPTVKIPGNLPSSVNGYRDYQDTSGPKFFFAGPPLASTATPATPSPPAPTPAPTPSTPSTPTPTPSTPSTPGTPSTPTPTPSTPSTPGTPSTPNSSTSATATCLIGSKGCSCTRGGGCDAGLTCIDTYCLSSDANLVANSGAICGASMLLASIAALL